MPLPPRSAEGYRLAINLHDLSRLSEINRQLLLAGNLYLEHVVRADKQRLDEHGVIFSCDLLRAAYICDTIRFKDRQIKQYPTRVYLQKARAWQKLASTLDLTMASDGEVRLNPQIFSRGKKKVTDV